MASITHPASRSAARTGSSMRASDLPHPISRISTGGSAARTAARLSTLSALISLTDQLIVSGELNYYWGDEETQFGQFENSSNIQFGLKYIIE